MGRALSIQQRRRLLLAHTHCRPTKVTDPSAHPETNPTQTSPTPALSLVSRPHLRFCRTSAVDQAVAGRAAAAAGAAASFCVSRPHGQRGGGRGPPAERAGLGAGPQTLACSAAAAIVVHKMATGPCALPLTLYNVLDAHPLKHWTTKYSRKLHLLQCLQ